MGKVNGDFVNIYTGQGANLQMGEGVGIEPFVSIICKREITIGNYTIIAPGAVIVDFDHNLTSRGELFEDGVCEPVHIGHHVWIGANAVILKGIKIGDNAVVGAGSVVTKDIPEGEIWAGNPAKFLKKKCDTQ